MRYEDVFCYSPLNRASRFPERNQSLLLQFMLMAFVGERSEKHPGITAMHEHLSLFPSAFPGMDEATEIFSRFVKRADSGNLLTPRLRREGISKLMPFLHLCKADEALWLFLIKQGQFIDTPKNMMKLLNELYAEDLTAVSLRMSGQFSARGFTASAKECISLFHNLQSYV